MAARQQQAAALALGSHFLALGRWQAHRPPCCYPHRQPLLPHALAAALAAAVAWPRAPLRCHRRARLRHRRWQQHPSPQPRCRRRRPRSARRRRPAPPAPQTLDACEGLIGGDTRHASRQQHRQMRAQRAIVSTVASCPHTSRPSSGPRENKPRHNSALHLLAQPAPPRGRAGPQGAQCRRGNAPHFFCTACHHTPRAALLTEALPLLMTRCSRMAGRARASLGSCLSARGSEREEGTRTCCGMARATKRVATPARVCPPSGQVAGRARRPRPCVRCARRHTPTAPTRAQPGRRRAARPRIAHR